MKRIVLISLATASLIAIAPSIHAAPPTPANAEAVDPRAKALLQSLHPVGGRVTIDAAKAALALGDDYYFLPADEAKRVLIEGWGNPPDAVGNVLGLVFPAGKTFVDAPWGAVITYESTGYVADDDAKSANYDEVLTQSRDGEEEMNTERKKSGYPGQHLVGWAQPPSYDPVQHALVWAREIAFDGTPTHTLNYDVRLLGRSGVLSMNMIGGMPDLPQVRSAAASFSKAASFETGARYADFDPSSDEKAEYGLAGLVAAGVGVVAAKKLGMLAIILAFGKKFIVLIGVAVAAVGGWFRKRFGKGGEPA